MKIYRLHPSFGIVLLACTMAFSTVSGQANADLISAASTNQASPVIPSDEFYPAYSGCGGVLVPVVRSDYEQQVVELVNQARSAQNLPPLKQVSSLVEAARYHAADMAQDNYFNHDSYDKNSSQPVCNTWARISEYYSSDWLALAENIAAGQPNPEVVMQGWMNSSGHRSNILSVETWEIGVGYASGGPYSHYWVQDFGRRESIYPIVINNEAAVTETRLVDLYIYGNWQEMRLRNDDGTWSSWQPFQSRLPWTLNGGTGDHQVWVELRSPSRTASSSDTIFLSEISTLSSLDDLPETIQFTYSITQDLLYPISPTLNIQNTGSSETLEWTASLEGYPFQVYPTSGVTPQIITITPQDCDNAPTGDYQGTLTITATGPGQVLESTQTIQLSLRVTDTPIIQLFLPVATQ